MKRIFLTLFLLLAAVSCDSADDVSNTLVFNVGDVDITNHIINQLEEKKIWYKAVDDSTLVIRMEHADQIMALANAISKGVLPEGRHASFPKEMFFEVVSKLDSSRIPYEVVSSGGAKWIVWEEEHSSAVREIIDDVSRRQNITDITEKDFQF